VISCYAGQQPDPDELDALQAEFPAHVIWREQLDGPARYVARGRYLDVHPHTVVTADPGELRELLRPVQHVTRQRCRALR
jgi:hypothetical protein